MWLALVSCLIKKEISRKSGQEKISLHFSVRNDNIESFSLRAEVATQQNQMRGWGAKLSIVLKIKITGSTELISTFRLL